VIAVGLVRGRNRRIPAVAADRMFGDLGYRVTDIVVIMDRILGLLIRRVASSYPSTEMQQGRIEELFLGLGVPVSVRSICSSIANSRRCS
jgi:hypothetical protein